MADTAKSYIGVSRRACDRDCNAMADGRVVYKMPDGSLFSHDYCRDCAEHMDDVFGLEEVWWERG